MNINIHKKVIVYLFVLSLMIICSGCSLSRTTYNIQQNTSSVAVIKIVKAESKERGVFNIEEVQTVIEEGNKELFLNELNEIPCFSGYNDPIEEIEGTVIYITYSDSSFELIGPYGGYYYNTKTERGSYKHICFDYEEFNDFICKYNNV